MEDLKHIGYTTISQKQELFPQFLKNCQILLLLFSKILDRV